MTYISKDDYADLMSKQAQFAEASPRKKPYKHEEGALQLRILKYLRAIGAVAGKTKTTGIKRGNVFYTDLYLFTGFPDLTAFYKSKIYFIEVKSETGKLSEHQEKFQKLCDNVLGVRYIVARTMEDVTEVIK